MKRHVPYTGQLYQLFSDKPLAAGAYVEVNGPWDRYGIVSSSKAQDDGRHLNVIRGSKPRDGERPVARF